MLLMCYYSSFPVQQIATGKSKLVFWDWNILCKHIHMRSSNGVVNSTSQVHPSRLVQKASILGVRHLSSLMRIHLFESGAAYLLPFLVLSCSWSRCTLQCTSKSNYSERYHIICSGGSRGEGGVAIAPFAPTHDRKFSFFSFVMYQFSPYRHPHESWWPFFTQESPPMTRVWLYKEVSAGSDYDGPFIERKFTLRDYDDLDEVELRLKRDGHFRQRIVFSSYALLYYCCIFILNSHFRYADSMK